MISQRQANILQLIIATYGRTKQPVGSKALMSEISTSSATIRNDMKRLESLGYLEKAHSSSGRLPSLTGYQYFIDHDLKASSLSLAHTHALLSAFEGEYLQLDTLLQAAADALTSQTSYTSFVVDVSPMAQVLRHFDLLMLDSHSVLAAFTLSSGEIKTKQFDLPRHMSVKDLQIFKQLISERFVSKSIIDIHYALRTELPQVIQRYFSITDGIMHLLEYVCGVLFEERLISSGKQGLLTYGSSEIEARYRFFSEDDTIIRLIREMTGDEQAMHVKLNPTALDDGLALMTHQFIIPYRGLGTLATVGPIDWDYSGVFALMTAMSQILTMKLIDYYRYLDGNHYEIQ